MFTRIVWLCAVLLTSACASTGPVGTGPGITVVDTLPAPTRADYIKATRAYLVGPFDTLQIDVFGVEDLQRQVQVDASGRLTFPLIGVIDAAGQTPMEIADEIEGRLKGRFVRDPQVTVSLEETVSQRITVDGQVAKPGLYPAIGRLTLLRAVATAGGITDDADDEDVVVFREVEGQRLVGLYNLEGIRRGNYVDPEVFPNDVVIVGDSPERDLFDEILRVVPLITTPLILLLRN